MPPVPKPPGGRRWVAVSSAVAFACGIGLLVRGYLVNAALPFTIGCLLAACSLLAFAFLAARRRRSVVGPASATAACVLVSLVALEWLPGAADSGPEPLGERGPEPTEVRRRIALAGRQIGGLRSPMVMSDPRGQNPFVLRPGSEMKQARSTVRINSLGFRGAEISLDKGEHYRIVALGESTTFGLTLEPGDRTWPEALEALIAAELSCRAAVQVVNAGVPGFNLENNLRRLRSDILPLQPDLVLSYHGSNGFHFILSDLPTVLVESDPAAPPRPSWLLARAENALRMAWFRRRYAAARADPEASLPTDVLETRYARLYRRLAAALHRADIGLVLTTFNMAVNEESSSEEIALYETSFPNVDARILANRLHTEIVLRLGSLPGYRALDTSGGLDGGGSDLFVDLIHLTQPGRERLARNLLEGIWPLLRADPALRCRRRAPRGSP